MFGGGKNDRNELVWWRFLPGLIAVSKEGRFVQI
jgi:hypothetical protein